MSGTLAVYIFEENHVVQEKIWSVLDSPKGVWTQAEISFIKPMPCKVRTNSSNLLNSGWRFSLPSPPRVLCYPGINPKRAIPAK